MRIKSITLTDYKIFKGTHTIEFNEGMTVIVGSGGTGKTILFDAMKERLLGPEEAMMWPGWRRRAESRAMAIERFPEPLGKVTVEAEDGSDGALTASPFSFIDSRSLEDLLEEPAPLKGMDDDELEAINRRFTGYFTRIVSGDPDHPECPWSVKADHDGVLVSDASGRWERPGESSIVPSCGMDAVAIALALALRDVCSPANPLVLDSCVPYLDLNHFKGALEALKCADGQVIVLDHPGRITDILRRDYCLSFDYDNQRARVRKAQGPAEWRTV